MTEALRSTRMQLENTDRFLLCHDELSCRGEHCTLHNRSEHHMRSFPQHWRSDRGLIERICLHGIGHPDPDEIELNKNARGVHGCDGCCMKENE